MLIRTVWPSPHIIFDQSDYELVDLPELVNTHEHPVILLSNMRYNNTQACLSAATHWSGIMIFRMIKSDNLRVTTPQQLLHT